MCCYTLLLSSYLYLYTGNPTKGYPQSKDVVELKWKIYHDNGTLAHDSNGLIEPFKFTIGQYTIYYVLFCVSLFLFLCICISQMSMCMCLYDSLLVYMYNLYLNMHYA